jgi:hypothetical protein
VTTDERLRRVAADLYQLAAELRSGEDVATTWACKRVEAAAGFVVESANALAARDGETG